ncbi:MAG: carboxypeptidase M32 [Alphaproteobacteria bacterium]|nr:carboxypeptidase M32 [Alphaproteobacteria bacterium]
MTGAYATLELRFKRLGLVNEAVAMLNWDTAAMMPEGAASARADQLAELKVVAHEMLADPRLPDLLDDAARDRLDDWQRANLAEMRRLWLHATAVPGTLVAAYSKACSECEMAWRKARPANDYASVQPLLQRVLDLTREVAAAKADKLGTSPYEALLDQFEPGGRVAEIDRLFDHLADRLPALIEGALAAQAARAAPMRPAGPFPVEAQRVAARRLMTRLGFEFDHGRLDQSLHPFCGGTPDDVRITTRYDEADFARALMGVLHETGHALYERGLPAAWRHQPVGEARGMSIHESQSLLIEMQVCRSREFLEFAAPVLRDCFGGSGPAWTAENLYRLGTRVARSLVRVDADEVTYPAHVILRYRLERALIASELELADLPDAWAEGMELLLAVAPPDDRHGCLQDIHWYDGAWGYFPTYTLGAMTAAQLYDAAQRAEPAIPGAIARGDFAPLLTWLRANVHGLGSRFSAREILVRATGKPLDAAIFEAHLRVRYLAA